MSNVTNIDPSKALRPRQARRARYEDKINEDKKLERAMRQAIAGSQEPGSVADSPELEVRWSVLQGLARLLNANQDVFTSLSENDDSTASIRELAKALERDYENLKKTFRRLEKLGIVKGKGGKDERPSLTVDEITLRINFKRGTVSVGARE